MSDNEQVPTRGQDTYLAAKLARLERLLEDQAARLHALEARLGSEPHTHGTRPFGQGTPPPPPTAVSPTPGGVSATNVAGAPDTVPLWAEAQTPARPQPAPGSWAHTDEHTSAAPSTSAAPVASAASAASATHAAATSAVSAATGGASAAPAARAQTRTATSPAAAAGAARDWGALELFVGRRLILFPGIVAVVLGVAFALREAFAREWIGPMGRVLLGGAAGCALLALAERLRLRGYRPYAYALSGGGSLILYLSIYAAFSFYHITSQPVAFTLMALVTATTVAQAARYDAYAIAILGLIGGFLTPMLLATEVDNEIGLFGYAALLDAGVLALAYYKQWRSLNHLAFVATWLLYAGWALKFYDDTKLWPTVSFLSLFFLMFAALALVYNVLRRRPARWFDASLALTNATLYFATCYVLFDEHRARLSATFKPQGPHALLLAGCFGLLYFIVRLRHPADRLLKYTYVVAAVTCLTLAVAIQLEQQWVTIGWATEALLLTWLGLRADEAAPRFVAVPLFVVAVLHWFTVDVPAFGYYDGNAVFWPLLNKRAVACAALLIVCYGSSRLYRRHAAAVDEHDRNVLQNFFVLAGNLLLLTLLTLDLNAYFEQARAHAAAAGGRTLPLENTQQLALSVLWTGYAAVAFGLGWRTGRAAVRYGALGLLAVVGLKIIWVDAGYFNADWHGPLFNQTAAAFAVYLAALWLVARLYARGGAALTAEAARVLPAVTVIGNVFALTGLSLEVSGYFASTRRADSLAAGGLRDLHLARQLALSVLWAVYGGGLLLVGLVRHNRLLRLLALALLGLTTLKVFLLDLAALDAIYRIISFIVLGAILLAVSFFYQQRQQRAAQAEEN